MAYRNIFKYTGPLTPDYDEMICIPRSADVQKVCRGIDEGDYWTILGPRQIGKTTFLNQLAQELSSHSYTSIYIDLEIKPKSEEAFYEMIINEITARIPITISLEDKNQWKNLGPGLSFYHFLKAIATANDNRKIVFLLDEIGNPPYIDSFLHMWRKVYIERNHHRELHCYALVIAGADDIISLTMESTSPFNISRKLTIENLEFTEAERLVTGPFKSLGITLDPAAQDMLIEQTAGHPQILQHLCYLLVEEHPDHNQPITLKQVDMATESLFKDSYNFDTLENQVRHNEELKNLVIRLLHGEAVKYLMYQKYSIAGSGPIVEDCNLNCTFRTPLYGEYLSRILDIPDDITPPPPVPPTRNQKEFVTTLYCEKMPGDFMQKEEEIEFLKLLFRPRVRITIKHDNTYDIPTDFSPNEKLFLCYLAYKNFKTIHSEKIPGWEEIPNTYAYRVSSNQKNNEVQQPEWDVFKAALEKEGVEHLGDGIRAWAHSIRNKLARIYARDLIISGTGRGSGYLLKGTVHICKS